MRVKTQNLPLFDGIELKSATFREREFPAHFHDSFAITVIEQGCERVLREGREAVQYARTVSVINPGEVHANRFFDGDAWHYKSFYLNADAMRFLLGGEAWFSAQIMEDELFAEAVSRFHQVANEQHLCELLPFFQQYRTEKCPNDSPAPPFLDDATAYLRRHLSEKVALDEVARHCRTDKFKLLRAFKKAQGITPGAYLMLCRIQHAKRLMQSALPLTQVALESGFYDQSHFIHAFKRHVGVRPQEYLAGLAADVQMG